MANELSELIFLTRSSYDYHEDKQLLIDLFRRCENTNSSSMSSGNTISASLCFHCETNDYLRSMEQYLESYCHYVKHSNNHRALAVYSTHLKRVHFGSYVVTMTLARLMRVDPEYRRKYLARDLIEYTRELNENMGPDYFQGYTSVINNPSIDLQNSHTPSLHQKMYLLNSYVIGTTFNERTQKLYRLTREQTEQFWIKTLSHWVQRPIIAELRLLMDMPEYMGTFCIGDFQSNQFAAATIWEPSKTNLCDDRSNSKSYGTRCTLRLILNFYQSNDGNDGEELLRALSHQAAIDGYPYVIFHVEQSSPFNSLCQKENLLGRASHLFTRMIVTKRMFSIDKEFYHAQIWLDPRDFSSLFFYDSLPEKIYSRF